MSVVIASAPTVLLVPKNRGLAAQVDCAMETRLPRAGATAYALRGEDIPYVSSQMAREGRNVVAYTGEDLLEDWLAAGNSLDARLKRSTVAWSQPAAVFGKPALCLIGTPQARMSGRVSIAVCARYRNLAARYLAQFQTPDTSIQIALMHGALEAVLREGLADFIVDIVVTGKTIREAGLTVQEVFFRSDVALLETP